MKKLLILLMASLLTLSTALAEVIYSPEVTALKAALAALREKSDARKAKDNHADQQ